MRNPTPAVPMFDEAGDHWLRHCADIPVYEPFIEENTRIQNISVTSRSYRKYRERMAPSVLLRTDIGAFSLSADLTPDNARLLAKNLLDAADMADRVSAALAAQQQPNAPEATCSSV